MRVGEVDLAMNADQAKGALLLSLYALYARELVHQPLPFEIRRRIRTTVPSGPLLTSTDSMSSRVSGRPWPPWMPDEGRQLP